MIIPAIAVFLFSCGNTVEDNNETGENSADTAKIETKIEVKSEKNETTFTDKRDGKTYKTVTVGKQVWLAENFTYKPSETEAYFCKEIIPKQGIGNFWVYDNNEKNAAKYGYLYDYETAQEIAPKGWHLPTKAEFEILLNHYGEKNYKKLVSDLSIVYSGWFYDESQFVREGTEVGFWTTDKDGEKNAYLCIMDKEFGHINLSSRFMTGTGAAVRLIKGEPKAKEFVPSDEPVYENFKDETPKTDKTDFKNISEQYDEIIKGNGYTVENPQIKRNFTEVTIKKKDGKVCMIEIHESERNYDNKWQYFYKNEKLFYVYEELSNSYREDTEGMKIFDTDRFKTYFKDQQCILFLYSFADKNQKYPIAGKTGDEILEEGNEYLKIEKDGKWNEF